MIVGNAIASVETGEAGWKDAVLHTAVRGWYEGHVEGEDTCPGCDCWGQLPRHSYR